jgi:hypothetical protein
MAIQIREILELLFVSGSLLTLIGSVAVNYSTWQAKGAITDIQSDVSNIQRNIIVAQQDLAQKQQEMAKNQQSFLRHYQDFTRKVVQNTNHNLVAIGIVQQQINDVQRFLAKNHNFIIKQDFPEDSIPKHTDSTP